jgi:hypothetical protein
MTMYLVTRYRIEQADKYLGANGFTTNGDADEFGGEVVECKRFSNIPY